jgi:hypothetical protein
MERSKFIASIFLTTTAMTTLSAFKNFTDALKDQENYNAGTFYWSWLSYEWN